MLVGAIEGLTRWIIFKDIGFYLKLVCIISLLRTIDLWRCNKSNGWINTCL